MGTALHWLQGPWRGRLALAARPRGGEWVRDEVAAWKRSEVNIVVSLLTPKEEKELDLRDEENAIRAEDMEFVSFPIPDRDVPGSETELASLLESLSAKLDHGKNVLVHCRQGIGRSGLVAACLLITKELSPAAAVEQVSAARGLRIPDTIEQRGWIDYYAVVLAGTR